MIRFCYIQCMTELEMKPKESRALKALKVLGVVVLCLLALVGALVVALIVSPRFRALVRDALARAVGNYAADQFDQIVEPLRMQVEAWAAGIAQAWGELADQVSSRVSDIPFEQAANEALSWLLGDGAPTVGQIAASVPQPASTGDYLSDVMLSVVLVCVVLGVVVWLVIRRRESARSAAEDGSSTGDAGAKRKRGHRWWVWLLAFLGLAGTVVIGLGAFLSGRPLLVAITIVVLGFTVRMFRADV